MSFKEELAYILFNLIAEISKLSSTLVLLVVLLVICVIVLDSLYTFSKNQRKAIGLDQKSKTLAVDGLSELPGKTYVSEIQKLAGRPDALVKEGGFIIPVEHKPLAKKIRDRYVAQLLVYMRLIEEFHGKKPPYGYLVIGSKCKRVKIYNTPEKQRWLQDMLDDMQLILQGAPAHAQPEPMKCKKCTVKEFCNFKAVAANAKPQKVGGLKIIH